MADLSSAVEAELARLRAENARLRNLLRMTPEQAAPPAPGQAAFFEAPPGMVHNRSPEAAKVAFFGALFAARPDIYATRWDNPHADKHGWIPAVRGGWRKGVRHEDLRPFALAHLAQRTNMVAGGRETTGQSAAAPDARPAKRQRMSFITRS